MTTLTARLEPLTDNVANRRELSASWLAKTLLDLGTYSLTLPSERPNIADSFGVQWKGPSYLAPPESWLSVSIDILQLTIWRKLEHTLAYAFTDGAWRLGVIANRDDTPADTLDIRLPSFQAMKSEILALYQTHKKNFEGLKRPDGTITYSECLFSSQVIVGMGSKAVYSEGQMTRREFERALRLHISSGVLLEQLYRRGLPYCTAESRPQALSECERLRQEYSLLFHYCARNLPDPASEPKLRQFLCLPRVVTPPAAQFDAPREPEPELPSEPVKTAPVLQLSEDEVPINAPPPGWQEWFEFFAVLGCKKIVHPGDGIFKEHDYLAFLVKAESGRELVVLLHPKIDDRNDAVYIYGVGGEQNPDADWERATHASRKRDARDSHYPLICVKYRTANVMDNIRRELRKN